MCFKREQETVRKSNHRPGQWIAKCVTKVIMYQ